MSAKGREVGGRVGYRAIENSGGGRIEDVMWERAG